MKDWAEKARPISEWFLFIVGIGSSAIALADLFGADLAIIGLGWAKNAPALILLVVGTLAWTLAIERVTQLRQIEKDLVDIKASVEVLPVIQRRQQDVLQRMTQTNPFATYSLRDVSHQAMRDCIEQARASICIISHPDLLAADTLRILYYDTLKSSAAKGVNQERIVWNKNQLLWLKGKLYNDGWDDFNEFSVKFLRVNSTVPSLATFDLFDQETVVFAQGWRGQGHIQINSPEVAEFFHSYFNKYWEQAEWIKKRGAKADRNRIEELIQGLPDV